MSIPDRELSETLDLIAKLVASVSDRLDSQGEGLARLTTAQAQAQAAASPERVAAATARSVRETLVPELHKIVDAMEELGGTKAVLRERWRVVDREEARLGRWRVQPWAVVAGIPLALVLVLALSVPRAAAYAAFTCRATGGIWSPATEHFLSGCTHSTDKRVGVSGA